MEKIHTRSLAGSLGALTAVALGQIQVVHADENGGLQEVVVTALRREQNANSVGVAVSALSGSQLADMNIQRTEDVVKTLPNVMMTSIFGPGTNPNWSIRGVTSNDYNDATEAPIAAYIDDVYLVSTGAGSTPFYDMARVEVLRGPQGTLFGRNSTGGAVQFISNEPEKTFSGSLTGAYGSHDTARFNGYVNAPISDSVQARLAAYYSYNQGFMKNIYGVQPDAGQRMTEAVRGQLAFEPSDTLRNVLKLSYSDSHGHTTGIWHDHIVLDPASGALLPAPGPDLAGQPPQYGWHGYNGQDRELKAAESYLAINKLEWRPTDKLALTSITGYNHYLRDLIEDCDGGLLSQCNTHYRDPTYQYSEELRLFIDSGAQRYTVGAYGLYQHVTVAQTAPLFGPSIALLARGSQGAEGEALFFNGEFDLGSQFTLIAGLRGSRDRKSFDHQYAVATPVNAADPFPEYRTTPYVATGPLLENDIYDNTTAGGQNHFTKYLWSGKLELDYKPLPGQLAYASISRGTKAPGYNNGFISGGLPLSAYLYKAEILTSYEVGYKATLLDHRLQLNADAYYYDYHNYDTLSFIGVGSLITNANAKSYGFEFDMSAKPDDHWFMSLNGSVAQSRLYDVANSGGVFADRQLPLLAKWTLSGRVGYETSLFSKRVGAEIDERATSKVFNSPGNDPASLIPGYSLTNARIFVGAADRTWEASVNVNNLFNRLYATQIFALYGVNQGRYGFYGDPRWVTAELRYSF